MVKCTVRSIESTEYHLTTNEFFGCDLKIAKIEPRGSHELSTRAHSRAEVQLVIHIAFFSWQIVQQSTQNKCKCIFSFFLFLGKHARVLLTRLVRTFYVNISDPLALFLFCPLQLKQRKKILTLLHLCCFKFISYSIHVFTIFLNN